MDPPNPIVERAVALAGGGQDREGSIRELIQLAGDQPGPLDESRAILVQRLTQQADDYAASGALTLINATIAQMGWHGAHTWTPRPHRLRNLS